MTTIARLILAVAIIVVITSADNGIANVLKIGSSAFFLALLPASLAIAQVTLVSRIRDPKETARIVSEILGSLTILYFPVILSVLWMQALPLSFDNFGTLPLVNTVAAILTFAAASYFTATELVWIARYALIVYGASVAADFFSQGLLFSALVARPAGFLLNPNDGGAQLVVLLIPCLHWRRVRSWDWIWCLVAAVPIALTLSRTAVLGWLAVSVSYMAVSIYQARFAARVAIVSAFVIVLTLIGATAIAPDAELSGIFTNRVGVERIEDFASLLRGDTSSFSRDPRYAVYRYWSTVAAEAPLIGFGHGYSVSGHGTVFMEQYDQGPHNMYLARYVDQGVLGIVSLLAFLLFWLIFFSARRDASGIVFVGAFSLVSLFSHGTVGFRSLITMFAFMAAAAVQRQNENGLRPLRSSILFDR
jgi:O-antigen ligase